ncbi:preprotein translocase subunit SecE [Luteimonas aestuarii]|uniref:Protein translocase subunit SecE n=1 Tax=Luteimonas aestuarii TaxID=453837 RepID=A0A4R5TI55_9GAMM|nr:preprotein translocase subunit SecE [Luteimonas aestuarii]TDK18956.1 preprotein translocase subunit SecE [Luteimonas aestuarii]
MNSRVEHNKSASTGDILKYALAVALVVAGVVAFYWFEGQWPTALRVGAVVAGVLAAVGVFMVTPKGVATRGFLSEARFELRKVVWPTRQEAVRMTWVVMIAVAIIALILMGFDAVIRVAIRFLLGQ